MSNLFEADLVSSQNLGSSFLETLAKRDFDGLSQYFDPQVQSRLLISGGLLTPSDVKGLIGRFQQWFGEADHFKMASCQITMLGDCLAMVYSLQLHKGDGWYLVQQQTYCDVKGGRIKSFDLLCSGFRPIPEPG